VLTPFVRDKSGRARHRLNLVVVDHQFMSGRVVVKVFSSVAIRRICHRVIAFATEHVNDEGAFGVNIVPGPIVFLAVK
jgi:hypothetical protein